MPARSPVSYTHLDVYKRQVPGGQGLARETLDAAMRVFDMRDSFISSASSGLKRVEGSLPFLIAANAARACDAQGSESVGYRGTAFAVPTTSASEFPAMEGEGIDTEGLEQACGGLEETAAELERISEEAATRKEEDVYKRQSPRCPVARPSSAR